jgi:hypothetical protein
MMCALLQVAHQVADVLVRRADFELHNGSAAQDRLLAALVECMIRGGAKGNFDKPASPLRRRAQLLSAA